MARDGLIGIVGAGIAGLACAARLATAGRRVRIFEKSKGLGGRLATRRSEAGAFDHGPPGFTAADPAFRAVVDRAVAGGFAAPWLGGGEVVLSGPPGEAFVGLPGASGFSRALAGEAGVTPSLGTEVRRIARAKTGWRLDDGAEDFATLVLAVPAPQAARLLESDRAARASDVLAALDRVAYRPVMSAMLALDAALGPEAEARAHPILAKAIRQNTLPGREDGAERWVLHGREAWSREHLDTEKPAIADALVAAFAEVAGPLLAERYRAGHRWRYALVTRALGQPCLWEPDLGLGLCGDWCLGDGVEHAWRSGAAMAETILSA